MKRVKSSIILVIILITGASLRITGINDPYVHEFDSCFQEAIAINHNTFGLSVTNGMSVTTIFEGKPVYHLAHPPLLQNLYSILYRIFDKRETIARLVSLLAWLGSSILLYLSLVGIHKRKSALPACLIFALLPLSISLGMTTNYEPLSIFIMSLILFCAIRQESRVWFLAGILASLFGALTEWTICFTPLALLWAFRGERRRVRFAVVIFIIMSITVMAQFIIQLNLISKIPVIMHSETRSSAAVFIHPWKSFKEPALLFIKYTWPAMIAITILFYDKVREIISKQKKKETLILSPIIKFWLAVCFLFLITAPQLVSVHPIALYYTIPLVAVLAGNGIARISKIGGIAILILVIGHSFYYQFLNEQRSNRFYYDLANRMAEEGKGRVYSAAAVGYFNFYHGMETIYPLGSNEPTIEEAIKRNFVKYIVLDNVNKEVQYLRENLRKINSDQMLEILFDSPVATIYKVNKLPYRKNVYERLYNKLGNSKWTGPGIDEWEKPESNILRIGAQTRFGIYQHPPREGKSTIKFSSIFIPENSQFKTWLGMDPRVMESDKGNGVQFKVIIEDESRQKIIINKEYDPKNRLDHRRFMEISSDLQEWEGMMVNIILETDALGDYTYDRAFWGEPGIYNAESVK